MSPRAILSVDVHLRMVEVTDEDLRVFISFLEYERTTIVDGFCFARRRTMHDDDDESYCRDGREKKWKIYTCST